LKVNPSSDANFAVPCVRGCVVRHMLRRTGTALTGVLRSACHIWSAGAPRPDQKGDPVRVLVVEDERVLADAIATGLRRETLAVDVAYDGAGALERAGVNDYDVIVLDRDLPKVHGDDVCKQLGSQRYPARIIMLTAAGELDDRVEGLSIGADDYLAKPFAFAELIARVRALGRRAAAPLPPVLERAGITLDPARREVADRKSTRLNS